jgi:sugar lactone lactonase YvrE
MTPQIAVDHKSVVGECPIWHPFDKKLYWIDIPEGIIFVMIRKLEIMRNFIPEK